MPQLTGVLETLPLIEAVGTSAGWQTWDKMQNLTPRIYVDSFGAALDMALHGNGVALVSEILAVSALASGQFVRADDHVAACEEGYYLRVNAEDTVAVQFRDWLLEPA